MISLQNIKRLFCTHNFVKQFTSVIENRVTELDGGSLVTVHTSSLGNNTKRCVKCGLMEYCDD